LNGSDAFGTLVVRHPPALRPACRLQSCSPAASPAAPSTPSPSSRPR
jgi:hypothetical protein